MPQPQVDPISTGNAVSSWITNNGVSTVLLFTLIIVVSLAIWKLSKWSAVNIFIPMRDRFFGHLDDLKTHLMKSDETMSEFQGGLKSIETTLVGLHQQAASIHAKVDEIGKQQKCKAP